MRRKSFSLACALALALCSALPAAAQEVFQSDGVDYTLELPTPTWKVAARPDGMHHHVEFVYGDRMDGLLRVRKELAEAGQTASDLAKRDQDVKLRYQPGFVEGKEERFAGQLNGLTLSYEFTKGGKPMAGRVYYLQADNRTVYTLHFTGLRDKLLVIRNQTDAIARSFRLK